MEKVTLLLPLMVYMLRKKQDTTSCLATLIGVKILMIGIVLDANTWVSVVMV